MCTVQGVGHGHLVGEVALFCQNMLIKYLHPDLFLNSRSFIDSCLILQFYFPSFEPKITVTLYCGLSGWFWTWPLQYQADPDVDGQLRGCSVFHPTRPHELPRNTELSLACRLCTSLPLHGVSARPPTSVWKHSKPSCLHSRHLCLVFC